MGEETPQNVGRAIRKDVFAGGEVFDRPVIVRFDGDVRDMKVSGIQGITILFRHPYTRGLDRAVIIRPSGEVYVEDRIGLNEEDHGGWTDDEGGYRVVNNDELPFPIHPIPHG